SIYFPETYRSIRENPRFRTHFLTLNPTMLCLNHTGFDSEDSVMLQGVPEGWIFFVSSLKTHVERQAH
ncbi:hypothetical protein, partial [Corynebacterium propinquum]|uniref:hypothetical protein n=1 Tax=Corynebacterium propinquum TaxID=43769 RepID=UPI0025426875